MNINCPAGVQHGVENTIIKNVITTLFLFSPYMSIRKLLYTYLKQKKGKFKHSISTPKKKSEAKPNSRVTAKKQIW